MSPHAPLELTQLLIAWSNGEQAALEKLMPVVYGELRRLARHYMNREPPGHTLQTTELVNEAYPRLIEQKQAGWQNRAHFLAISARLMRRILVSMARARHAERRGGAMRAMPLEEALVVARAQSAELVAIDEALTALDEQALGEAWCKLVSMAPLAEQAASP